MAMGEWPGEWSSFLTNDTGGSFSDRAWTQCFSVTPGNMVEVGAMAYFPPNQGSDDQPTTVLISYQSNDCTTGPQLFRFSGKNQVAGEWTLQDTQSAAAFDINSFQLVLVPPREDELVLSAYFDNVY